MRTMFMFFIEIMTGFNGTLLVKSNFLQDLLHQFALQIGGGERLLAFRPIPLFTSHSDLEHLCDFVFQVWHRKLFLVNTLIFLFTVLIHLHLGEAILQLIDFFSFEVVEEQGVLVGTLFGSSKVVVVFGNVLALHLSNFVRDFSIVFCVVLFNWRFITPAEDLIHRWLKVSSLGFNAEASLRLGLQSLEELYLLIGEKSFVLCLHEVSLQR